MKDDYSQTGLKEEWSLLLHSFLENKADKIQLVDKMQNSVLSKERIKALKKDLSSRRKKLNLAIEKIKIKIDQVTIVVDNLTLVGSETSGLLQEIDFLNHEGEKISEEIHTLDQKIKKFHELQDLEMA